MAAAESREPVARRRAHVHGGDDAHPHFLCGLGAVDRHGRAVAADRAREVTVHRRDERDAFHLGRHGDDPDHPDRGALMPQLGLLRHFARAVCVGGQGRCAGRAGQAESARRAGTERPDGQRCRAWRASPPRPSRPRACSRFWSMPRARLWCSSTCWSPIAQIRLRRKRSDAEQRSLAVQMWWFPVASYVAVGGMVIVLVAMACTPDHGEPVLRQRHNPSNHACGRLAAFPPPPRARSC